MGSCIPGCILSLSGFLSQIPSDFVDIHRLVKDARLPALIDRQHGPVFPAVLRYDPLDHQNGISFLAHKRAVPDVVMLGFSALGDFMDVADKEDYEVIIYGEPL